MGNFNRMKNLLPILLLYLAGQSTYAQEFIESRTVLNTYNNGQTMREYVKYQNKDTLVEFIYFKNGQVNSKRQVLDSQRNGWSYIFNEKGVLIFRENYKNGELCDDFYCFYPNGRISRIEKYRNNHLIDTATYFNEDGLVLRTIAYLSPCEFASPDCDLFVTIFENDSKVYGYNVYKGLKSETHIIYNQSAYAKLMAHESQIPLHVQGETIFRNNCGMCHKLDKPIVGPALSCITETTSKDDLIKIIGGDNGHNRKILTEKEIDALIEYIKTNCP